MPGEVENDAAWRVNWSTIACRCASVMYLIIPELHIGG
jgi:hypothetical protein